MTVRGDPTGRPELEASGNRPEPGGQGCSSGRRAATPQGCTGRGGACGAQGGARLSLATQGASCPRPWGEGRMGRKCGPLGSAGRAEAGGDRPGGLQGWAGGGLVLHTDAVRPGAPPQARVPPGGQLGGACSASRRLSDEGGAQTGGRGRRTETLAAQRGRAAVNAHGTENGDVHRMDRGWGRAGPGCPAQAPFPLCASVSPLQDGTLMSTSQSLGT